MSDDLNEIQTKIALLEKDAKTGEQIHRRLEIAIDKLSDCAISLKGMLAQQEQKLTKAEQTDEDIFITLESRRKEWDNDLKELHSRITTNTKELRENQNTYLTLGVRIVVILKNQLQRQEVLFIKKRMICFSNATIVVWVNR